MAQNTFHVALSVKDLPAAIEHYRRLLLLDNHKPRPIAAAAQPLLPRIWYKSSLEPYAGEAQKRAGNRSPIKEVRAQWLDQKKQTLIILLFAQASHYSRSGLASEESGNY